MAPDPQPGHYITPEQLCIGLFVHLDLSWTQHPFTFSSFKIKSLDQIATIQSLGLTQVRYSPEKSDGPPLPPPPADTPPSPPPLASPLRETDPAFAAKRERMARLQAQRDRAAACEKELLSAAKTVKSINKDVFAKPEEVRESAKTLIAGMAASMLVDADVSIQLMADKVGDEDVYYHSLNVSILSMMLAGLPSSSAC